MSRSHTWRFHRSGRGCHMVPSPWERRSFLRGMRQGGAVTREISLENQVRVGQWGATSRTCSLSSLSLHSVCASRLTGGNAYLRKVRGQLCASASVPRGPSVREKYSWQWEDSGETNRSTWASPNRLQISRIISRWSRHSPGMWAVVRARRPHDWAAPGCEQHAVTWTACDSRGGDGGRAVTCGVIVYLGVTAAADAICPRSLWNCFSGTTFLPLKELRQFSTVWARSSVRRCRHTHRV